MRVTTRLYRALLIVSMLVSSVALAQGTSVITGTVTDAATGKPVPDVVVTAKSSALQGEEVVVTDAAGLYRLAQLPPGEYTIKLEKESYKPFSRAEITVRSDRTIRVNIQVQPESVQSEQIVVVAKAPTVDVGSTSTGINVGKEFINNIAFVTPNANGVRSFESLASVAPQVVADGYGYGFSGAQSPENLYIVDGVSVSDPAYGVNGAQFPVEFVQEANVVTGGYQAEYGRATGGVLNVVTKSGSNEFHGSVWGDYTPGLLTATPPAIRNDASAIVTQSTLWNTVDFGAELGGPILKDKLWFYAGISPSWNRNLTTRSLSRFVINEAGTDFQKDPSGLAVRETIPGTTQRRFDDNRALSYIAKLTFLINSDNNLSLSVVGTPSQQVIPYSFNERRRLSATSPGGSITTDNTNTVSLRYQGGFLDKHLLVDASIGWFHSAQSTLPNDGVGLDTSKWASGVTSSNTPAVSYRRTVPYGISDFETLSAESASLCEPAGNVPTRTVNYRGTSRYLLACPATGPGVTYTVGGFGFMNASTLDRWQGKASLTYLLQAAGHHIWKAGVDIEHLSYLNERAYSGGVFLREAVSGALRFDDYRQYGYQTGPDQNVQQLKLTSQPTGWSYAAFLQDSWSIMDVITLNAGVRYETQQLFSADGSLGLSLANQISPRVGLIYDFTQQGRSKLYANYARYYESVPLDMADRSLTGENQFAQRHMAAPGGNGNGNVGCNPLEGSTSNGVTQIKQCSDPTNTVARNYDAVTVSINKAFADGWMAQLSYTWSYLRGNYAGLFRPETGQLDPNINSDFDLLYLMGNRTGPLDGDRTHLVKAYAAKEFQLTNAVGLLIGLTYEGMSGQPISYLGSDPGYGLDEVFVLPRGSAGRLPFRHTINAKAGVSYHLNKDQMVQFTVDIFNLLNFQAVTQVDNRFTSVDVLPYTTPSSNPQQATCVTGPTSTPACTQTPIEKNPATGTGTLATSEINANFKSPTAYQPPFSIRFGLKFTF